MSDKVKELVGISKNKESCDMDIAYAFEMLWLQGDHFRGRKNY